MMSENQPLTAAKPSAPKPLRERKRWVAIATLYLQDPCLLIEGKWLDDDDRTLWHEAKNAPLQPGTFVASGSVFECAFSPRQERNLLTNEFAKLADDAKGLHFDLEALVGGAGADMLRASDIWTLEDIAAEKEGVVPLTELNAGGASLISMRDLLATVNGNKTDLTNEWIEQARQVTGLELAPDEPTEPAPDESPAPKEDSESEGTETQVEES